MSCALFIAEGCGTTYLGGFQGFVKDSRDPMVLKHLHDHLCRKSLGKKTGVEGSIDIFFVNTEDRGVKHWQRVSGNTYHVHWEVEPGEVIVTLSDRQITRDKDNCPVTQTTDYSGTYQLTHNAWGEPISDLEYIGKGGDDTFIKLSQAAVKKIRVISFEQYSIGGVRMAALTVDISKLVSWEREELKGRVLERGAILKRTIINRPDAENELMQVFKHDFSDGCSYGTIQALVIQKVTDLEITSVDLTPSGPAIRGLGTLTG